MALSSKEYWKRREEEQLKHNITEEAAYSKELDRIYVNMLDSVQTQIDSFYGKYADKEGITLAEAKKRVKNLDIEAYERKAAKYVAEKNFSKQANEEMRLYNATMKINRLELLKAQIGLETIAGHDELEKYMESILQGRTMDELQRQAGILGKALGNNAKTASAIVNGSFHSGTFSDRIWQYQDMMRVDLEGILTTAMIQGKNPRAVAKDLRKYWYGNDPKTGGGARYCMERLMRTELARVQTEAQKQSFERNGYDEYIFIVNGGCCPLCEAAAKKDSGRGAGVYYVKDMMPGENAPPMHPNCRCSTAAHMNRAEYEAWLDSVAGSKPAADVKAATEKGTNKPAKKGGFAPAKDMKEAKQRFANALGIANENINLGRMKTDLANMYLEGVERFMNDFPMLKGYYGKLGTKASGNTFGLNKLIGNYEYKDGARYLRYSSELHLRNPQDVSKMMSIYERISKSGEGYANSTPMSTAIHELVHGIDKAITLKKHNAFDETGLNGLVYGADHGLATGGVSRKIIKQVREEMYGAQYGKEVAEATRYLGSYARTSTSEELAEAISYEYVNPSNPYSARILELFKEEVKGAFGK